MTRDRRDHSASRPRRGRIAPRRNLRLHNAAAAEDCAMLKIWGRASSSNVQKVLWCCAELELPFERVDLGGPFGGNRDREYLNLNPNGLVPTVVDGDLVMWESNTICRYLAATRSGGERLYPRDPAARTHVERWMDWQLAVVGPPMGQLLFGLVRSKPEARDAAAIEAARRHALAAWTIVEDELQDRAYLAGNSLSLAEIVLGTQIYRWFAFPIERPALPRLRAWYDRLRQHPGFKTHIETPIV
jgi:glutathione S-transferase